MTSRPWVRPSARVLVLDPTNRVLLFGGLALEPRDDHGADVCWFTPGGGLEDGEDLRTAAVRELAEEIGLVVAPADLEGPVWLRRWQGWVDGVQMDSRETFFVLRDVEHEVDVSGRTELERQLDHPHRWWSAADIAASGDMFAPRDLAALLSALASGPWTGAPRVVD